MVPSHVELFAIDLDLGSATARELKIKKALTPVLDNYDIIVCDCPPNLTIPTQNALVLEPRMTADSLAFFLEAQNDALVSHVFGNLGSWRSALKALRSCIENVAFCLYYKDHPVELHL